MHWRPPARPPQLRVHLKPAHRSGNIVLRTYKLLVGYPDKQLFKAGEIELWYQERAALIGPNGAGKTTFIRTVLGQLEPLAGEVRLGSSLKIGYFAPGARQPEPRQQRAGRVALAQRDADRPGA